MSETPSAGLRGDRKHLAIAAIVFAVFALSLGDALIKLSSASFSIWQIYVLRSLAALPVLIGIGLMRTGIRTGTGTGPVRWSLKRPGWAIVRSLLLACMWMVYYAALPFVQLSVAAAAYYTLPLFIVLLARVVLLERIGRVGWLAVVLGFSGVLVMLRPKAGDVNVYAFLPIVSAVLYAVAMILTRTKCREEDPMALSLALNVTFVLVGVLGSVLVMSVAWPVELVALYPFVFGGWAAMGAGEWLIIAVLGAIIVAGSVLTAIAYQNGPAAVVSVFDYAYLVFAAVWGLSIFGEVPDLISVIGIAMIASAGIIAAQR